MKKTYLVYIYDLCELTQNYSKYTLQQFLKFVKA